MTVHTVRSASSDPIHYGPCWYSEELRDRYSFAACEAGTPSLLTTHKPWVNCPDCLKSKEFKNG